MARSMDMTKGPAMKQMLTFGIPIFFGSVFQQLYSMVDSIVVGNYVSADALAAVGTSATVSNFLVMGASGLAMGASVVVAQLLGANQKDKIKSAISTTLIFVTAFAIVLSIVGLLLSESIMGWIQVPENIFKDSLSYMRIYLYGTVFMMLYNFYAAVLRALGDSRTPLIFLIISSVLNIFGDLFLVIVVKMGVAGVALATVISQAVSVLLCSIYVRRKVEYFHFDSSSELFSKSLFKSILRMGVPSALQSSVTSLGFITVQSLVNSFGSVNIAAYTAASKMEGLCHLPVESFAMSLSVFAGQNMGAGNVERSKKGMWSIVKFSICICAVMAVVIFAVGPSLIGLFVDSSEKEVISRGAAFLKAFAPLIVFHSLMNAFNALLRGAGDSFFAMLSMIGDLGTRVAMAYLLSLTFGVGFMGCAYAIPCGWVVAVIIAFSRYLTGKWQTKTIVSATPNAR